MAGFDCEIILTVKFSQSTLYVCGRQIALRYYLSDQSVASSGQALGSISERLSVYGLVAAYQVTSIRLKDGAVHNYDFCFPLFPPFSYVYFSHVSSSFFPHLPFLSLFSPTGCCSLPVCFACTDAFAEASKT